MLGGLGAAAPLPTTLALISHAVPDPRERGRYVGLWAATVSVALVSSPVIAGRIVEHAAWRWSGTAWLIGFYFVMSPHHGVGSCHDRDGRARRGARGRPDR
ncbi:MFS transporter [Streptomyces sp. NPDC047461]|uniref:MFS transporter n=1 Tax=Streptomyces sp. NPDC047461 TaxID=3155619 RepID=UPI0033E5664D